MLSSFQTRCGDRVPFLTAGIHGEAKLPKRRQPPHSKLEANPVCQAQDVKVAGTADAVVLTHVINVTGEMIVESLADAQEKPIPHPVVEAPVVLDFVCGEES